MRFEVLEVLQAKPVASRRLAFAGLDSQHQCHQAKVSEGYG